MDFKDKHISVIGMARTGIAAANFLVAQGARVTLMDGKPKDALEEVLTQIDSRVDTVFGTSTPLPDAQLVILSPGVDIYSPHLDGARQGGAEIIGELELAYRADTTPIIAITGTNGKSTTTALIGHLLTAGAMEIQVGGNIGVPFISMVEDPPKDYMVLEVSSFQLESTVQFRPRIGVLLNITPDHLDRHKTLEHYAALKQKITANQTGEDLLVFNQDDPEVRRIAETSRAHLWPFSATGTVERGVCLEDDRIVFKDGEHMETLCRLTDLQDSIRLQLENVLAAVLVNRLTGLHTDISKVLREFQGLEHRMEWVRSVNDVDFVNDSKGTNIGALEKSLNAFERPIILIAGGQDKGGNFESLKPLFKQKVKYMVLIGEARARIQAVLNGSFGYEAAEDMDAAVRTAYAKAQPGDVVLLSPACASFDMFKNFEDRGRQFKQCVQSLEGA